jgi:hypothetical protein
MELSACTSAVILSGAKDLTGEVSITLSIQREKQCLWEIDLFVSRLSRGYPRR